MNGAFLTRAIDNSPLIVFRIILGLLISLECFGAIATGWVRTNLVEPAFTFNFIGFDWLQPLVGPQMYLYFVIMGLLGIGIMIGYRYRFCIIAFTLMWTIAYLLQKTAYNNHYYLLILIAFIMCFLPANCGNSIDVRHDPSVASNNMPAFVKWIFVAQLFLVYTYAAIAKIYGDWLDLRFIEYLLQTKADYPVIGTALQTPLMHKIVATYGILFDLLVIPALLWKRTRVLALVLSIVFHLFNSIVFQIGIFPYLSLGFMVFFFEPEQIRRIFLPKRKPFDGKRKGQFRLQPWFYAFWGLYFSIQLLLPLRHYAIGGEVLWTEEGHRLSWRMMLRSRTGNIQFVVVDKGTGTRTIADLTQYLTPKQQQRVAAYPDFIWQFAQRLQQEYAKLGQEVAVFAHSRISINGRPGAPFINSTVDLAGEKWDHFRHHEWILPSPLERMDQSPQE